MNLDYSDETMSAFLKIDKSLKFTANVHSTDIFTILNILDSDKIKNYYRKLSKKWWKPQTPKFESNDRESAENMISVLPIIVTGARNGDIIIGTKTQSANVVMRVKDVIIPPKTQVLDNIRGFEDLWQRFLSKLRSLKYFAKLTKLEREMWLDFHQSDRDLYLEDIENLNVEVLSFGNSDFLNLDEEILEQLGKTDSIFQMKEIVDVFPRKPGSEGLKGRHTLMFRRGIWKVSTVYQEVKNFIVKIQLQRRTRGKLYFPRVHF